MYINNVSMKTPLTEDIQDLRESAMFLPMFTWDFCKKPIYMEQSPKTDKNFQNWCNSDSYSHLT